jgi:hypothetical protein
MNNVQKLFLDVYGQGSTTVEDGDNSYKNSAPIVGAKRADESDKKSQGKEDVIRLPVIRADSRVKIGTRAEPRADSDTNTLLEKEARLDDCILAASKLRLEAPPNLVAQDFHRLILFSRQVEIFTDEVMYVCFFQCQNLESTLADIAARIHKAGHKVKVQIFCSSNIGAMKKYIFNYCNKVLGVLTSEVTRYVCKLVDLSLCACTSTHDNWLLHTLLSNPNLLSEDGGGGAARASHSVASSSLPSFCGTTAVSFIGDSLNSPIFN